MIELRDRVVVVTGASSGIGRETALRFARRGCRVVLAARREDALDEAARDCEAAGAQALVVPTDVTVAAEVAALVDAALARFGRIDVWVNNAGVTLFAPLEEAPFEEHRRVIETNLFGPMHAARALLPVLRRQRRGVVINVGSVLSRIGQPYVPSYAISKHALRGLSEVLRTELADELDVHVCSIFPYAVDTPHFEEGANEIGLRAHTMPPVQSPEVVAEAIVDLATNPRRERYVPRVAALGLALHELMPRTVERLLLHALRRWHFAPRREPTTEGNLYAPPEAPPSTHGTRPPVVSTPRFALWAVRELGAIVADATRHRVRALRAARAYA